MRHETEIWDRGIGYAMEFMGGKYHGKGAAVQYVGLRDSWSRRSLHSFGNVEKTMEARTSKRPLRILRFCL